MIDRAKEKDARKLDSPPTANANNKSRYKKRQQYVHGATKAPRRQQFQSRPFCRTLERAAVFLVPEKTSNRPSAPIDPSKTAGA